MYYYAYLKRPILMSDAKIKTNDISFVLVWRLSQDDFKKLIELYVGLFEVHALWATHVF